MMNDDDFNFGMTILAIIDVMGVFNSQTQNLNTKKMYFGKIFLKSKFSNKYFNCENKIEEE